jgi:formylglycine-generating enzyme required for sulfatase activity
LFVEVTWLGAAARLYWQAPEADSPGRWTGDQPLGVDAYGLYGDLTIEGVTQRFRWILPGTFRMGSPESEPERYANELQHEVTLTQGFWLADTACTQALWQAVMSGNPSTFKDDPRNPVETVSWEDAQRFIAALNARVPGLQARLPTEAEWEYACRAGTTTPFSFGENITPEQVNYHGGYPYAGGKEGLNRQRTVPVASLPANPWGVYEMHGNVWEWCQDWYGEYPSGPQVDPRGPAEEGAERVLRGGSWISFGRYCRSAYRFWFVPAGRYSYLGFRLARGQGASQGQGQASEERPAGQPRGTRGGQAGRGAKSGKSKKAGKARKRQ